MPLMRSSLTSSPICFVQAIARVLVRHFLMMIWARLPSTMSQRARSVSLPRPVR